MLEETPRPGPGSTFDNTGRLPQTCTGRLLSIDVASGERMELPGDLVPGRPSWSPDGLRLAFSQASADGSDPAIYVVDRDGENLTRLADGDGPADWSPDGTWLEFNRWNWDLPRDTDHAEVWVVPVGGGKALRIAGPATAAWSVGSPIE
jgi:dipeptidyl aminopeptidase/acylaminoacyl peptidase